MTLRWLIFYSGKEDNSMIRIMGKSLIVLGVVLVVIGAILILFNKVSWIGKLPGDVLIKRGNFTFYFPFTTCILISGILSLLVFLFFRR
ncbi:MAG: DUF2905 domain-containing protein [Candidatus Omnitrophota bacterium]